MNALYYHSLPLVDL